MTYSDQEQALRVASAISAVATGCCLRYGLFASILRQSATTVDESVDAFPRDYDLLRTIGLSTTEDMIHPTRTWLVCRIGVPEPVERYFLHGFQRWHVEWIEVVSVEGIVLPTDPMKLSLQTIMGLTEKVREQAENSRQVRLVAQPGAVSLDRVAQQYARATTGIATDQLWAALRQWGAATLTFVLIQLQPAYTAIAYTLCGQLFGILPVGWAITSVGLLLLGLLWRQADLKGQSILADPGLVLSYLFAGLVAAIFGLWANAIIRESRSRQELIEAQAHLAAAERQAGILEERQRLAREIHDTLAQGLTSIVWHLEAAEEVLAQDSIVAQQHLNQARQTARDSLTEARRFVWALRPESLERDPLPEAITRVAEQWSEEHRLLIHTHVTGTLRPLPPAIEVTLLRAAQEALANVSQHARASEVTLTLSFMYDVVALDIQDDGLGFDQSPLVSAPDADNFGLVAMRQRVEQWGAHSRSRAHRTKAPLSRSRFPSTRSHRD